MKERITGLFSLIGIIGWSLFCVLVFIQEFDRIDVERFFIFTLAFVTAVCTILYITWTRFGTSKELQERDKIKHQNEVLKQLIEQKELKKKLDFKV